MIDYGIQYSHSKSGTMAIGYTDADLAEDKDWKSISGNVFIMSGGAVVWSVKKQGLIALSMLEAEYISLSHVTQHILWHQMLIHELGFKPDHPFNLHNNNCGAIALMHDLSFMAGANILISITISYVNSSNVVISKLIIFDQKTILPIFL